MIRQYIGVDYDFENSIVLTYVIDTTKKIAIQEENHKEFKTYNEMVDYIKQKVNLKLKPYIYIDEFGDRLYNDLDDFYNIRDYHGNYLKQDVELIKARNVTRNSYEKFEKEEEKK